MQKKVFVNLLIDLVTSLIEQVRDCSLGWKLSGAGAGGYLIVGSDKPVNGAIQVVVRRGD